MPPTQDTTHPASNLTNKGNRSPLAEQTSKVTEDVRELGHMALNSAGEAIQSVKERGSESLDRGRERLDAARDGVEGYVSENPIRSVLIAAGVGALIGIGLRARS